MTGSDPVITIAGTVSLNSNAEVSGFNVASEAGPGITGEDVQNVTMVSNQFANTAMEGIYLRNVVGEVVIRNTKIFGTRGGEFDQHPGIWIENNEGSMSLEILHSTILDTSGDGIKVVTRGTAQTTAVVDSNTVRNTFATGIKFLNLEDARVTVTVSNNSISQNIPEVPQSGGIRIGSFNRIVATARVLGNEISDNQSNGVFLGVTDSADVTVEVLDNRITNNVGSGIFFGVQKQSVGRGEIS
jgi:hypothetical protein